MNNCILILPYFGKFNNYFELFIKSCEKNDNYNWLIITDNDFSFNMPNNVKVIKTTLEELKEKIENKLNMKICLSSPYKLCDYKPSYGYVFYDEISEYKYWGHCDCDLLFGNLNKLLTPLLDQDYDKIFAAGHLTLYKNSIENNKLFMSKYKGRYLYKEAYSTNDIYVLDEDCVNDMNVHSIFLFNNKKVFSNDLSFNASVDKPYFLRDFYSPEKRCFVKESFIKAKYYWDDGNIYRILKKENKIEKEEYIYIHLQGRKIFCDYNTLNDSKSFRIYPSRFKKVSHINMKFSFFDGVCSGWSLHCFIKIFIKKIKRKLGCEKK